MLPLPKRSLLDWATALPYAIQSAIAPPSPGSNPINAPINPPRNPSQRITPKFFLAPSNNSLLLHLQF